VISIVFPTIIFYNYSYHSYQACYKTVHWPIHAGFEADRNLHTTNVDSLINYYFIITIFIYLRYSEYLGHRLYVWSTIDNQALSIETS